VAYFPSLFVRCRVTVCLLLSLSPLLVTLSSRGSALSESAPLIGRARRKIDQSEGGIGGKGAWPVSFSQTAGKREKTVRLRKHGKVRRRDVLVLVDESKGWSSGGGFGELLYWWNDFTVAVSAHPLQMVVITSAEICHFPVPLWPGGEGGGVTDNGT
jgi:hypothetical protein